MIEDETVQVDVRIELKHDDPVKLDRLTRQLRSELINNGILSVKFREQDEKEEGTKAIDPVVLGALIIASAPSIITKILEFLHAWAIRREDRVVKVKIQTQAGNIVEIEVPETMSQDKVKEWIDMVNSTIKKNKGKK